MYDPREVLAAAPDALAAAFGVPVNAPHPLAAEMTLNSLSSLAHAAGRVVCPQRASESDLAVQGRGIHSADFSSVLASATQHLARRRFDLAAGHRAFCAEIECRDFRPVPTAVPDVDTELPAVGESAEFARGPVLIENGMTGQLSRYGMLLPVSRQVILNDTIGILAAAVEALGSSAARTEAGLVYGVLEANPVLDDHGPTFHADFGNVIASALDKSALGAAMAALRTQETIGGNIADSAARHLVVAAGLELPALELVHTFGLDLTVTATTRLPQGRWYLSAAPELAPTVATLKLRGAASPILIEQAQSPSFDGAAIKVSAVLGAVVISRVGIVRGGTQ
nr:hypothetical protein [Zoogloeaceae bacterium]